MQHGNFLDPLRHVGDLGNLEAGENGEARVDLVDPVMALTGLRGVVGRAIVVTSGEDDLGRGNNAESASNGNSGTPLACGVIAFVRWFWKFEFFLSGGKVRRGGLDFSEGWEATL